jgi:hypothetical protein
MVSIPKVVGVMSCAFLLCLGLSTAAQADNAATTADKLKTEQSDRRQGGQEAGGKQLHETESGKSTDSKTITGEVLRCEGSDCVIKGQDGNEVLLHIDLAALQEINSIAPGEHIEAMVNDQDQVLLFLSTPTGPNRRNDKE